MPVDKSSWIDTDTCQECSFAFSMTARRHHCRACSRCLCDSCCTTRSHVLGDGGAPQRTCVKCLIKDAAKRGSDFPDEIIEIDCAETWNLGIRDFPEGESTTFDGRCFTGADLNRAIGHKLEFNNCVLYNSVMQGNNSEVIFNNCILTSNGNTEFIAVELSGMNNGFEFNNCVVVGTVKITGGDNTCTFSNGSAVVGKSCGIYCTGGASKLTVQDSLVSANVGIGICTTTSLWLKGKTVITGAVNDNAIFNAVFSKGAACIAGQSDMNKDADVILVGPVDKGFFRFGQEAKKSMADNIGAGFGKAAGNTVGRHAGPASGAVSSGVSKAATPDTVVA
eukprot:TRINITY_DN14965_c0_g1_i1.p1 TRINITY_DN14965_c0_g1~~TRINITY_DN14965_c0_g1_i1.p1  ORF type:complete len:336 (-),score=76.99 TRINITY_DN14965_c0_g1_i1:72-1079(-)